ncbi:MAG: FGLLP motif-containing membrane protein [Terrimesophilobacter sp.]
MILRKLGVAFVVSALLLVSFAAGSTSAVAAPIPPTINQTFPDPWITDSTHPQIYGTTDIGNVQITVESSLDGINFIPYCVVDNTPPATVWSCLPPVGSLPLGINEIRATGVDGVGGVSAPGPSITITVVNAPTITSPADGVVTNDYEPTFAGASDGSYFDVYTTDFSTHFCGGTVVNSTWNCTPLSPVPDGDYTYLVETTFGATTIYSGYRTIHIDTVLNPLLTDIDGPPGVVDGSGQLHSSSTNPTPTITGTSEPSATITMWQNYAEVGCAGGAPVANATGNWSCTLAQPLTATGTYIFGSQHTDPAGNTNVGSSPDPQLVLTYTDTTPPLPPVVTTPIGTVAAGMNAVLTNSTGATVTGTGEPGSTLYMFGNNCMIWPTIVDASGNWTCQLTTPMSPDGDYDVFFGLTDAALNSSPLASPFLRFTIDTVAPAAPTVTAPIGPMVGGVFHVTTTNNQPLITGAAEDGATVQIYRDGSIPVPCVGSPLTAGPGGFSCQVASPVPYGTHDFSFAQTDLAGNSSGPAVTRLQLTVPSPPAPPPPAPPAPLPAVDAGWLLQFSCDSDSAEPGQRVTLTGSDLPPGSTVTAELHSTPIPLGTAVVKDDGTWVLNTVIPVTVEPGQHHYVVTVTPSGGTAQTAELPVTVVATTTLETLSQPTTAKPPTENGGSGINAPPPVTRDSPSAPNVLSQSLPTLYDVISNPIVLASAAASSLALLFLVAFPAEILNSTLDENYERIFGKLPKVRLPWLTRLRNRLKHTPLMGGLALTTLAALILSFADPHFGFDFASLRLFLACAIGMFVLGYVANAITGLILRRRWSITSVIELQPFGLLVALVGVVLSRVLDFAPGLLIGLVLGLSLSASTTVKEEARSVLVWAGVILGISGLSWIVYSFLSGVVAPSSFTGALFDDSIVAIATEGISGLVIGLLPLGFLDGRSIFRNSKWQWLATYTAALMAFFVIVVPSGALWGEISESFWVWLIVLIAFALACVGTYLWFQTHPAREGDTVSSDTANATVSKEAMMKEAVSKETV